jgi:hypothetical protein
MGTLGLPEFPYQSILHHSFSIKKINLLYIEETNKVILDHPVGYPVRV